MRPLAMRRLAMQRALPGVALLTVSPVAAAVAAEGGMPQLDASTFAPQLIWLAITFVVLYVVMAKVALPRVGAVLEARADHVNDDLRRAEEARREAETVLAAYEKALAEARAKASAETKAVLDAVAAESQARQDEAARALAAEADAAEARIAAAKTAALGELNRVAGEVAAAVTERLIGAPVAPEAASRAVARAMERR